MRAFTIVVHPSPEEERHIATVPDLPGWITEGRTVEECVERAREAIGVFVEDIAEARAHLVPEAAADAGAGGVPDEAEEEAVDALRRAMAALRTVETHLEEEITRRPDGHTSQPLRRAHVALLRARSSLVDEERRAAERSPG
jgi:predicted RNase H-like HicB family nuclease